MNHPILSKQSPRPRALPVSRPFPARVMLALLALTALLLGLQAQASDCPELLRHQFKSLQTGEPQDLCQYRGKVVLVVNTASYCGFTDQYGGLEELYSRYKERGLVVLGFPSNDFGGQEPGSSKQIAQFCRLTYGVEFPMFEKSHVVGDKRNGLYAELHRRTGQQPRWNFHKYLIDPSGGVVKSYESAVAPDDRRLVDEIRRLLDARRLVKRTT